jgi:hypothetical protein
VAQSVDLEFKPQYRGESGGSPVSEFSGNWCKLNHNKLPVFHLFQHPLKNNKNSLLPVRKEKLLLVS